VGNRKAAESLKSNSSADHRFCGPRLFRRSSFSFHAPQRRPPAGSADRSLQRVCGSWGAVDQIRVRGSERKARRSFDTAIEYDTVKMRVSQKTRTAGSVVRAAL
jgi:hypothetical protein